MAATVELEGALKGNDSTGIVCKKERIRQEVSRKGAQSEMNQYSGGGTICVQPTYMPKYILMDAG